MVLCFDTPGGAPSFALAPLFEEAVGRSYWTVNLMQRGVIEQLKKYSNGT